MVHGKTPNNLTLSFPRRKIDFGDFNGINRLLDTIAVNINKPNEAVGTLDSWFRNCMTIFHGLRFTIVVMICSQMKINGSKNGM
jgi:hypothetical protein